MSNFLYEEDLTGVLPANLVPAERQTVTFDARRDFHFFIPKHAPFHAAGLKVWRVTQGGLVRIEEHSGFYLGGEFQSMSHAAGRPVYSAVVLPALDQDTEYEITYQSAGSVWSLDAAALAVAVAEIVINPVGLTWEQIANTPGFASPVNHPWRFSDMVGEREVVAALAQVGQAIASKAGATNGALVDVRDLSRFHFGLDKVPNSAFASLEEALAAQLGDVIMSPLLTLEMLRSLGLLDISGALALIRSHMNSQGNLHELTLKDLGVADIANIGQADDEEVMRNLDVEKYMTLRQVRMWWRLHGPALSPTATFHKAGTKLASYCRPPHRFELIANGTGGTHESMEKANDVSCGANANIPISFPIKGFEFETYCSNGNQMALVSDGQGGAYPKVKEVNSRGCAASEVSPEGTIKDRICEGTTEHRSVSDGQGGIRIERIENSLFCNVTHPAAGTFIRNDCSGTTLSIIEADGSGGERIRSVENNSASCGYVPPTVPPVTLPPAGTKVGFRCENGNYYDLIADGVGGNFPQLNVGNKNQCATPAPSIPSTPAPTTGPRIGTISFTTTHTVIYRNDTEVQRIMLTGWTPNTSYTLDIMGDSTAWGAPNSRKLEGRAIRTDSSGNATMTIVVTDVGIVAVGTYRSWFMIGSVESNSITRRFMGDRF